MNSKLSHLIEKKVLHPVQGLASFFRQYLIMPSVIGALAPSSSYVAREIAAPLNKPATSPRRILEIGAGTGVITKYLLKALKPGDHLDLIECVPELAAKLRELIEQSDKKGQVTIHENYFQDVHFPEKFDHVISGLPLASFSPELVRTFYCQLDQEFLKEGGLFSYYEYLWIPECRMGLHQLLKSIQPEKLEAFSTVIGIKKNYLNAKPVTSKKVWLNFTPMRVVHVKK